MYFAIALFTTPFLHFLFITIVKPKQDKTKQKQPKPKCLLACEL